MAVWFLVGMLVIVGWVQSVHAQTQEGEFKTWRVFTLTRGSQKTCYITGSPTAQTGAKRRGDIPYVVVTHRGKNLAEVSVSAGYTYKEKSTAEIVIDAKPPHAFFTSPKTPKIAWARDTAEDKAVVGDMLQGGKVTVAGTGAGKMTSKDTYDLQGFPQAYARMQELCTEESKSSKATAKKDPKAPDPKDPKATGTPEKKAATQQETSPAGKKDAKVSEKKGPKSPDKSPGKSDPKTTAKQSAAAVSKQDPQAAGKPVKKATDKKATDTTEPRDEKTRRQ